MINVGWLRSWDDQKQSTMIRSLHTFLYVVHTSWFSSTASTIFLVTVKAIVIIKNDDILQFLLPRRMSSSAWYKRTKGTIWSKLRIMRELTGPCIKLGVTQPKRIFTGLPGPYVFWRRLPGPSIIWRAIHHAMSSHIIHGKIQFDYDIPRLVQSLLFPHSVAVDADEN